MYRLWNGINSTRIKAGFYRKHFLYKEGIGKILGEEAEIKSLTHEVTLEILDLDEITTRVIAIYSRIAGMEYVKEDSIKNLRPSHAGT